MLEPVKTGHMRKTIGGKTYDTERSTLIGAWKTSNFDDHGVYSEKLYLTPFGEYFLDGHGGALSKYARFSDLGAGEGREFCRFSETEAREWVKEHLPTDEYSKIFGEVPNA